MSYTGLSKLIAGLVLATLLSLTATKAWAAPFVQSISVASSGLASSPTAAFTVVFNEPVKGVSTMDFDLKKTGSASGSIASVSGTGTTYTVSINTITGWGTLRLDLNASGTGIIDNDLNPIVGGFTSGSTLTVGVSGTPAPTPVPTLSQWAMILLAVLLAGGAALRIQGRRQPHP